ncbi:hypothetical protein FOZ61_007273 [Perkinsus olseni]|uniref:Uncharacterized protein n=1 Tax=Perkinsus olseni TaxID=32597 RepID=A0A7J6L9T2_PEROL|nr:hypothetical protein FOZ61_007273 [Perkinsus olseni]KAF4669231.1 hypothetical protein FOL46_001557 [Perkinsus olseni]
MPTQSCPFAVEEPKPTAPAGHLLCQEGSAMSKRSSTRVNHAPGGASSLNLSHEQTAAPDNTQRISSNCFASKTDPNGPNSITGRPITKVHAPPGGKGSFSIGSMHGGDEELGAKHANIPPGGPCTDQSILSSNTYAKESNMNGGNHITNRRITKVQAPPGGCSNFTLG